MTKNLQQRLEDALAPSKEVNMRVFSRMQQEIAPKQTLWSEIRQYLKPKPEVSTSIWQQVRSRLQDVPHVSMPWQIAKWSTAFVLVAAAVKVSPFLFLAPITTANDEVILIATKGEVIYHSDSGFKTLQEGNQIRLTGPTQISSEGTFSVRWLNEGVLRGDNADIVVLDIASRKNAVNQPTVDYLDGDIWVQGSVLKTGETAPFSVKINENVVAIHDGSAAINQQQVAIHDRRATVFSDNTITTLAYHQTLNLENNVISTLSPNETKTEYVLQQLAYDAVHKDAIKLRLQEHFQANVGISPDSNVYFLKRVAEEVDEFLTFDREARLLKQAQQAQNRYIEAGILLADNQVDKARLYLEEYSQRLKSLQLDSPEGELIASNQLAANVNTVANTLPDDEQLYPIKEKLLETSAELQGSISADDVDKTKFIDELLALQKTADSDDLELITKQWLAIKDRIPNNVDIVDVDPEKELSADEIEALVFEQETRLIIASVAAKIKNNEGKPNPLFDSMQEIAKVTFEEEKTEEQEKEEANNKTLTLAEQILNNSLSSLRSSTSRSNDIIYNVNKASTGLERKQQLRFKERLLLSIYNLAAQEGRYELTKLIRPEITRVQEDLKEEEARTFVPTTKPEPSEEGVVLERNAQQPLDNVDSN